MGKVICITALRAERDALVESHLDLVPPIARGIARNLPPSFDIEDLIATGRLALVEAANRFKPSRKVPFEIYAKRWIRGEILSSIKRGKYRDATHEAADDVPERGQLLEFPDPFLRKRVDTAIAQLSPKLREVIELYYSHEQLTFAEVAARVRARQAGRRFQSERASQLHMEAIRILRQLLIDRAA
jgi:RNA polymerase sigma factor (sigma-70 family)